MNEIVHKKGKIYYSIGEVAEMFDVNPSLIRFWETKFDIIKPHKNKKGNRMFTPQDIDNLKLIYHLVKERGMTLAGAKKRLKDNKDGAVRDMEIVDRLLSIRSMLVEIREELKGEGEIFTPEGYLDEEYTEAQDIEIDIPVSTAGITGSAANEEKPEAQADDEFVIITSEVITEMVTDGSSPWEEEPAEEQEEPVDEAERTAAMEELRNIKNILDGWNDIEAAAGTGAESKTESAWPEQEPTPVQPAQEPEPVQSSAAPEPGDTFGGLGNIFDDELDDTDDYSDPWEEIEEDFRMQEEEPAPQDTGTFPGAPESDRPKPGDVFGTDACTTFSPDDSEAMANTGAAPEASPAGEPADEPAEEEPQRPRIYEQTLF